MKQVILIELDSFHHGRGVLEGICSYVRPADAPWVIHLRRWHELRDLSMLRPDGVIANLSSADCTRIGRRFKCPVVSVLNADRIPYTPSVFPDDLAIGRSAAEYFLDRGFREFAIADASRKRFARQRSAGFWLTLRAKGFRVRLWSNGRRHAPRGWSVDRQMRRWIKRLPKPVAVFCPTDAVGFQLLQQCRQVGVGVPDDVAVLGVDDDPVRCELATPPLSSIRQPSARVGFDAAQMLERLMHGRRPPKLPVLVSPLSPVSRQSTDVLAVEDRDLAAALRYVREHAHDPANVGDILRVVPVTRRWLERAYAQSVGRSPLEDITRAKVARARALLETTDLPLQQVAGRCGFSDVQKLTKALKLHVHTTPGAYRARFRVRH